MSPHPLIVAAFLLGWCGQASPRVVSIPIESIDGADARRITARCQNRAIQEMFYRGQTMSQCREHSLFVLLVKELCSHVDAGSDVCLETYDSAGGRVWVDWAGVRYQVVGLERLDRAFEELDRAAARDGGHSGDGGR